MLKQILPLLLFWCAGCALTSDIIEPAPEGKGQAVVFDIDGTLTPDVFAVHTARTGAAEAVQAYAGAGHSVVYLTARITLLQSGIPGWLEKNGFPEGQIHVTQSREDRDDHAAFKLRVLQNYVNNGWTFIAAYGDSSTDFEAYAEAGIPAGRVFALRRKGDDNCQPGTWAACYAGWVEQMDTIRALAGAEE